MKKLLVILLSLFFMVPALINAEEIDTNGLSVGVSVGLPFAGGIISYQSDVFNISGMVGKVLASPPTFLQGNSAEITISGNIKKSDSQSLYVGSSVSCATYYFDEPDQLLNLWGVIAFPIGITQKISNSNYWIDFKIAPCLFYYSGYSGFAPFFSTALSINRRF